jgi:hypothetical protein
MRKGRFLAVLLGVIVTLSFSGHAFRVGPSSFHLEQSPGTEETYAFVVTDDTDHAEEVRLYLGDWLRAPNGEHDWDVPLRGARWTFSRAFSAGETVRIRYAVGLPAGRDLRVSGEYLTHEPRLTGAIAGPQVLAPSGPGDGGTPQSGSAVSVTRTAEKVDASGLATVSLDVRAETAFFGITLYEVFSEQVEMTSLDAAGGTFNTVNRSCADWISLSEDHLRLSPGESREVSLRVAVPAGVSGTYWSAVFIESAPTAEEREGTRILSIYRTAVKVYVTAPGTEVRAGRVTAVQVAATDPLTLVVGFENTGNVQLAVAGGVDIIDQTGTTVRSLAIEEFLVLPGGRREVELVNPSSPRLAVGVYQAVARLDYGGENPVGGVRTFRVK